MIQLTPRDAYSVYQVSGHDHTEKAIPKPPTTSSFAPSPARACDSSIRPRIRSINDHSTSSGLLRGCLRNPATLRRPTSSPTGLCSRGPGSSMAPARTVTAVLLLRILSIVPSASPGHYHSLLAHQLSDPTNEVYRSRTCGPAAGDQIPSPGSAVSALNPCIQSGSMPVSSCQTAASPGPMSSSDSVTEAGQGSCKKAVVRRIKTSPADDRYQGLGMGNLERDCGGAVPLRSGGSRVELSVITTRTHS